MALFTPSLNWTRQTTKQCVGKSKKRREEIKGRIEERERERREKGKGDGASSLAYCSVAAQPGLRRSRKGEEKEKEKKGKEIGKAAAYSSGGNRLREERGDMKEKEKEKEKG